MHIEHNFDMEQILFVNLNEGASMFREIRSVVFVNFKYFLGMVCVLYRVILRSLDNVICTRDKTQIIEPTKQIGTFYK